MSIPQSVTSIGGKAFLNCSKMESFYFNADSCGTMSNAKPDSVFIGCAAFATLIIGENVRYIPENAFTGCKKLTEVTIPGSVAVVGSSAFSKCEGLTTLSIKANTIKSSAFSGCKALTDVTIDEGVAVIGKSAFSADSMITSITLPNSVSIIGDEAFKDCKGLTTLSIGEKTDSISYNAFLGCKALTSISANNLNPVNIISKEIKNDKEVIYSAFDSVRYDVCVLYVPAESIDEYKAAEGWKEFKNIVPIPTLKSPSADINDVESNDVRCYVTAGGLLAIENLPEGAEVIVYDATGRAIKAAVAEGGHVDVSLPARGLYLVRINDAVYKVMNQ